MVNERVNLVLCSLLMIGMKALESRHHIAELKVMLRRELRVWPPGLRLEENRIIHTRKCPRRLLRIHLFTSSFNKRRFEVEKFTALTKMICWPTMS